MKKGLILILLYAVVVVSGRLIINNSHVEGEAQAAETADDH